ncbi:DUF2130 domain-containing protein [Xylanimonas ulmi]|uniref:DUF2130 domain-containing protein n=1 Tax=Xylanimonas ulmi TaxID=228973 RepID=A0A4Q7M2L3_9MICO|nr:DUF2130 domain-containing protein [Xylanibacterium ulmi]RZS61203.1 hypothetical protein EV386_1494 [Xylanibacterium ulmi]
MTHEITCPHCKKAFTVDEAGYASIVAQVRSAEFQAEVHERLAAAESAAAADKDNALAVATAQAAAALQQAEAGSAARIAELKTALDAAAVREKQRLETAEAQAAATLRSQTADKDAQIARLKAELDAAETGKRLAVQETIAQKDARIAELTAAVNEAATKQSLAVVEAVSAAERERDALQAKLDAAAAEAALHATAARDAHAKEVALLNETIQMHKDFKARLSTKMLGETLEQHCEMSFEELRATAFQTATFGKDNDASSGSKGDYIFRDFADGVEFVSIMFEMKNEADTTATKKRNADFYRELDKDRREKGCEHAVLVSMLEPESDLFNRGIVDVSHEYEKMYVIRPQFFIPMITLLRNAAQDSIKVRTELERIQQQNVDITNFEESLKSFQDQFKKRVGNARSQYESAIKAIDNAIKDLEKIKEAMRLWSQHLDLADRGLDEVTIRKLTRGNPTMTARFAALALEADEPTG